MEKAWPPDPLLDEVDEARLQILAEHGNDHRKVWAYYIEQERHYADRMIDPPRSGKKDQSAV
jgi:hypothetical protein